MVCSAGTAGASVEHYEDGVREVGLYNHNNSPYLLMQLLVREVWAGNRGLISFMETKSMESVSK